jgi:hypothetical protein
MKWQYLKRRSAKLSENKRKWRCNKCQPAGNGENNVWRKSAGSASNGSWRQNNLASIENGGGVAKMAKK